MKLYIMPTVLYRIFGTFLDLLAPPRGTEECVRTLTLPDLQDLAADEALPYREKRVRALVWELKYRKNPHAAKLAGAYLAEELLAVAGEELGTPLLIPVPMHPARRKERGYNQTEFLCEAMLAEFSKGARGSIDYAPDVLARTRATPPQQGLPKYKRLKNIKNSMEIKNPARVRGRVCVVVDDVTTTGATFKECERALKEAGARGVRCVALARS